MGLGINVLMYRYILYEVYTNVQPPPAFITNLTYPAASALPPSTLSFLCLECGDLGPLRPHVSYLLLESG